MVCVRVSRCALVIEWPFTIFLHEIGLRFAMGTSYNKKVSVRVFVRVRVRIPCAYLWELQCRDKPVKARGICIGSGSHAGSVLDPVLLRDLFWIRFSCGICIGSGSRAGSVLDPVLMRDLYWIRFSGALVASRGPSPGH